MKKLLLAILTVAVSALPGCGSSNEEDGAGGDSARYTIAVVPKGLGHQFWLTVKAGADAAGAGFNANII